MMKMLIKLDEDKIRADGQYDVAAVWNWIDKQFARYNCIKESKGEGKVLYSGNPISDYFTCMGLSYLSLRKQQWFAQYCSEWVLYSNEDDEDLPLSDEDLLAKERMKNPLFSMA